MALIISLITHRMTTGRRRGSLLKTEIAWSEFGVWVKTWCTSSTGLKGELRSRRKYTVCSNEKWNAMGSRTM